MTTFNSVKNISNLLPPILEPEREIHSIEMAAQNEYKIPLLGSEEDSTLRNTSIGNSLRNFLAETFSLSAENEHLLLSRTESGSEDSLDFLENVQGSNSSTWSMDADTDIQGSITAIREEASRVDTVMAMDKLDTLQRELRSVSEQLTSRSAQLRELRTLVQLKDNRMSTLELERDLYKADAERFKTELHRLAENIHSMDVMGVDASGSDGSSSHDEPRDHDLLEPKRRASFPMANHVCDETCEISEVSGPDLRPSSGKPKRRKPKHLLKRMVRGASSRTSETVAESMERTGVPEQQDLHECLRISLETGEGLRSRLGMISVYYESVVANLRESLEEERAQREKIQSDVVEQIDALKRQAGSPSRATPDL